MSNEVEKEVQEEEVRLGSCLLWFLWGMSISFLSILSIVLLVLLIVSTTLNVYLGWELAGLEVSVSREGSGSIEVLPIPSEVLAAIPTNTPEVPAPTTQASEPTNSAIESQAATVAALATEIAAVSTPGPPPVPPTAMPTLPATPIMSPTVVPTAVAIGDSPSSSPDNSTSETGNGASSASPDSATAAGEAQTFVPPATSSNSYDLIPIDQRESRPAEEHGDLNLALRDPQPIDVELSLVDIPGSGIDPHAPKLSKVFDPNFINAYTVHDWDWSCNCKGVLLQEDGLVLVGIITNPGEPLFIPHTERDIYDGKYFAVVLYADEDSLTVSYSRAGSAASGYMVHYEGLYTDPNLIALFQESKGNELPGLTLDTPVGVAASDELIVAVRDNGKFLDARSRKDWWE